MKIEVRSLWVVTDGTAERFTVEALFAQNGQLRLRDDMYGTDWILVDAVTREDAIAAGRFYDVADMSKTRSIAVRETGKLVPGRILRTK